MKTIRYIIIALFTSVLLAQANKERPISEEEMKEKSNNVATGEVVEVRTIQTTIRNGVEFKETEASFKVTVPSKGVAKLGDIWILKYVQIEDPRYKGDRVPSISKGEFYLIYGRKTETNAEGKLIVYLSSGNELRKREAVPKK